MSLAAVVASTHRARPHTETPAWTSMVYTRFKHSLMRGHRRDLCGTTPRLWRTAVSCRVIAVVSALFAMLAVGCGRVQAAPAPASSIPAPRPVATGAYQVGAYYFPGWPTLDKWKVLDPFPGAHAAPRLLPGRRSRRDGLADQVGRRARGVLLRLRLVLGPRTAPARARPPRRLPARALPPVPEVLPAVGQPQPARGRRRRPTCWRWSTTGSPTTSGGPST